MTRSNNEYFVGLCHSILNELSKTSIKASIYYYGSYYDVYKHFKSQCDKYDQDSSELIILLITDYLTNVGSGFDFSLLKQFHNKTFLILTNVANMPLPGQKIPENVFMMHMGPDWCHNMNNYKNLSSQNKIDNDGPHWINFNRNVRHHRVLTGCYLMGQELGTIKDTRGIIRFQNLKNFNFDFIQHFEDDGIRSHLDENKAVIFENGWQKFLNNEQHEIVFDENELKLLSQCKNAENYDQYLRSYYETTVLEIVSETICYNDSIFTTEKTLHTFYAMNFPIVISSPGVVNYLRTHGFDVFDDIIDHSYDQLDINVHRITRAIDDNIELLTDSSKARHLWHQCRNRFENNLRWAQGPMYQYFHELTIKEFNKFLKNFR